MIECNIQIINKNSSYILIVNQAFISANSSEHIMTCVCFLYRGCINITFLEHSCIIDWLISLSLFKIENLKSTAVSQYLQYNNQIVLNIL